MTPTHRPIAAGTRTRAALAPLLVAACAVSACSGDTDAAGADAGPGADGAAPTAPAALGEGATLARDDGGTWLSARVALPLDGALDDAVRGLLQETRGPLGLSAFDGFPTRAVVAGPFGTSVATLGATHGGVEVYGASVAAVARDGALRLVAARLPAGLDVDTVPLVDEPVARAALDTEAVSAALGAREPGEAAAGVLTVFDPALVDPDGAAGAPAVLAWRFALVTDREGPLTVLVSAGTGEIVAALSEAPTALDLLVGDARGEGDRRRLRDPEAVLPIFEEGGPLPVDPGGTLTAGYKDAEDLRPLVEELYAWWDATLDVRGFDGQDGQVYLVTDWGFGSTNAAWFGRAGALAFSAGMGTRDILAHEYAHAAQDRLAGGAPLYAGESGAVNEHLADAFAWFFDPDDTVGEGSALGVIRDMRDPASLGQPACYAERRPPGFGCETFTFFCGDDSGFVHVNSAIGNRALMLMAHGSEAVPEGGPACLNQLGLEVGPVPRATLERVYGLALYVVGRSPSYRFLRQVMEDACALLAGAGEATAADCRNVAEAWAKVGVGPPVVEDEEAMTVTLAVAKPEWRHDESVRLGAEVDRGIAPYTYRWSFGDGASDESTFPQATHRYDEPGTYTATVAVTDAEGRQGGDAISFTVLPPPPVGCREVSEPCPVGTYSGFPEVPMPSCPPSIPRPPDSPYPDFPLTFEGQSAGCLGPRLQCRWGESSPQIVVYLNLHPASAPQIPPVCGPNSCTGEAGSGWTTVTWADGSFRARILWAEGAYANVHMISSYDNVPEQRDLILEAAEALLAAGTPYALACNPEEYGAPSGR